MRWPTGAAATASALLGLLAAALAAGALLTLLPERPPVLRINDAAVAATATSEGVVRGTIATGYRMYAYPAAVGPRTLRDRVVVAVGDGARTPTALHLAGSRYALTPVGGSSGFHAAARLTGSSISAGNVYRVNVGYEDGSKLFPDTLHEQGYPCGLAPCPRIGREPLLASLLGLALGALAAFATATLQPFSTRRRSPQAAGGAVAALAAVAAAGGAFAYEARDAPSLAAAAAFAAAGAALAWTADRRRAPDADGEDGGLLPDREIEAALRRGKPDGDRWVLVAGAAASGKSALVEQMLAAARTGEAYRLHAPTRRSEERDGARRVAELNVIDRNGGRARLWFWESRTLEAPERLPSLGDFDGVVLAADPTRAAAVADTFPPGLAPEGGPVDVDREVLRLAEAFAEDGPPRGLWPVITKADLIRYSVAEPLLAFPVRTGPEWYAQMANMDMGLDPPLRGTRRYLAERIGLGCLARDHPIAWRSGNPYLAYSPTRAVSGRPPFGGDDLLRGIRDALL